MTLGEMMDEKTNSLIEGKYLSVCLPEMAYEWLHSRTPDTSVYRNAPYIGMSGDHDYCETVLLERNDPLIDFGLARYGWSIEVANKLYERLDHAAKCAMRAYHLAQGGPAEPFFQMDVSNEENMREMIAWIYNPHHSDEFFDSLFNKTGVFEHLSDDNYLTIIYLAGQNKRLSTPYDSLYLDGGDDYRYHEVFSQAWKMTLRVPTTQPWAQALEALLQNAVRDRAHDFDVSASIARWRIDDKPVQEGKWYDMSPSFYLRSTIADLLEANDDLLDSDDLALRGSFYKRFQPYRYKNWPDFAVRDSGVFFEFALRNMNLWRNREERERLSELAWNMPDPHSMMDAPNDYRACKSDLIKKHPEWFSNDESMLDVEDINDTEQLADRVANKLADLFAMDVPEGGESKLGQALGKLSATVAQERTLEAVHSLKAELADLNRSHSRQRALFWVVVGLVVALLFIGR